MEDREAVFPKKVTSVSGTHAPSVVVAAEVVAALVLVVVAADTTKGYTKPCTKNSKMKMGRIIRFTILTKTGNM